MDLNSRIQTFIALGEIMAGFPEGATDDSLHFLKEAALRAEAANRWFTQPNIHHAIRTIGESLTAKNLNQWLLPYENPAGCPTAASQSQPTSVPGPVYNLQCSPADGLAPVIKPTP